MGTLVVHRLINDRDRSVVERASGEIDRSAAAFLPTLGPGEAIVIGVDIPVPLSIRIQRPERAPDSTGPDHEVYWANAVQVASGGSSTLGGATLSMTKIDTGEYQSPNGTQQGVRAHIHWFDVEQIVGEGSCISNDNGVWECSKVDADEQSMKLIRVK